MDNFAVFIMVWGRPEKMWTAKMLRKQGYTGKIYYVADDLDETLFLYKEKYGDDLLVFSKEKVKDLYDAGDNTGDLRSTLYAANYIRELAKEIGVKYYSIYCDDYTSITYKHDDELNYVDVRIKNLDRIFELMIDFYERSGALSISTSQHGDFIGGKKSGYATRLRLHRKVMNTFICSVDRPFEFMGRLNEDVTTYVNLGHKGGLFLSVADISVIQNQTQSQKGGLTDVYLDYGTYVKSFFSVMYNPSCVKVSEMGTSHIRVHHMVKWNNAVPKIISPDYKK